MAFWLVEWALLIAGIIGLFIAWDLLFCGGRYCKRFSNRA